RFGQGLLERGREVDAKLPGLVEQIPVDAEVGGPLGGFDVVDRGHGGSLVTCDAHSLCVSIRAVKTRMQRAKRRACRSRTAGQHRTTRLVPRPVGSLACIGLAAGLILVWM